MKSIIALLWVCTVLCGCGKSQQEIEAEIAKKAEAEAAQKEAVEREVFEEKAKPYIAILKNQLKDPDSVQLRNLHFAHDPQVGNSLCGEVNAKNSNGGYVGFTPFAVTDVPIFNSKSRVTIFNANGSATEQLLSQTYLTVSGCLSKGQSATTIERKI